MFVNDGQEIVTAEWRLSSALLGYKLNARRGVSSVYSAKPCLFRSRVSQSPAVSFTQLDMHNPRSKEYTLC